MIIFLNKAKELNVEKISVSVRKGTQGMNKEFPIKIFL